jgi:large subunit ribosomal protein L21|tara:strand:+ start:16 stop:333 length:318 start_codon:yes stop_codon:yes gene_type:complete
MKYAIVEISGRQFWIEAGKYYDFNRIPTDLGKQITLNRILLLNDDGNLLIGQPYLESVKIKGKILEHFRGKKTSVYKMRPKKKTRKKQGHRQALTRVFIEDIVVN